MSSPALIGIVWAVAWWFVYRDPERYRAIAPREVDALLAERTVPAAAAVARFPGWSLFRYRSIWGLMIGLFCLNFAIYFFITWFPVYLLQARGFSLARAAAPSALLPGGDGASWATGWAAMPRTGCSSRAGRTPRRARPAWSGGMLMASSIGLSAFVESTWVCLALFTWPMPACPSPAPMCWTVASEIAPTPGHVASIGGIQNFAGNLAGIMITTFTGRDAGADQRIVPDPAGDGGRLCVVGALSYLFLVGKVEPLEAR